MMSIIRKKRAQKILNRNAARRAATSNAATRSASKAGLKPVQHQHWVKTDQLTLGMYVAELNVPWEETDFLFQGFNVDSTRVLKQVQDASDYALVRTQKVAYRSSTSSSRLCSEDRAAT